MTNMATFRMTALLAKCPVFLTNDRELPAIPGIRILTVQAFLPPT